MKGDQQRKANAVGSEHEGFIEAHLAALAQMRIIEHWHHTGPGLAWRGRQPIAAEKGQADFVGVFRGGLSFGLESKACTKERFYKREIEKHPGQVAHLDALVRAGAPALLSVCFVSPPDAGGLQMQRRFAVPWDKVPWRVVESSPSITADLLAGWEIKHESRILLRFVRICPVCRAVYAAARARCSVGCAGLLDGEAA